MKNSIPSFNKSVFPFMFRALMLTSKMVLLHIVEVVQSLLAHASMPLKHWDEAFLAATFLINRTPTKLLDFDTPLHRLYKENPDYASLRTFGCACWPNLRPYNSKKLQFRSVRCIFLGYSNLHKGFKCLDASTGQVYISRDVVFDENVFPFSQLNPNAGSRLRTELLLLSPNQPHFSSNAGGVAPSDHTVDGQTSALNFPNSNVVLEENHGDFMQATAGADSHDDPAPAAPEFLLSTHQPTTMDGLDPDVSTQQERMGDSAAANAPVLPMSLHQARTGEPPPTSSATAPVPALADPGSHAAGDTVQV